MGVIKSLINKIQRQVTWVATKYGKSMCRLILKNQLFSIKFNIVHRYKMTNVLVPKKTMI